MRCGLGSDGAACNNRLDTFSEMGLGAGIARVLHRDEPSPARDLVALATCDGAEALGLGAETGSLEVGKQADIAVVRVDQAHHGPDPLRDVYTTIVHAARANDVRLTLVQGRVLYRDGEHTTLEPARCVNAAAAESRALAKRAGFAGATA